MKDEFRVASCEFLVEKRESANSKLETRN